MPDMLSTGAVQDAHFHAKHHMGCLLHVKDATDQRLIATHIAVHMYVTLKPASGTTFRKAQACRQRRGWHMHTEHSRQLHLLDIASCLVKTARVGCCPACCPSRLVICNQHDTASPSWLPSKVPVVSERMHRAAMPARELLLESNSMHADD
jgi:hypothetical protein